MVIFLLEILILACDSSPAFCMIYSAEKLNKQDDNIQPWHTPFPIWNQSVVPCPVLTVAPWPVYRFLKRQVRCLICPSLSEFSTVYCDPHSQRFSRLVVSNSLWHHGLYAAHQALLSMTFSRQEYLSELPFPSSEKLVQLLWKSVWCAFHHHPTAN